MHRIAAIAFLSLFSNLLCAQPKYRVVIMTDMTHDDGNSLIRYLYYANELETEAIIVTPQLPDYTFDATGPWDKATSILNAYATEYEQLKKHHSGYPTPSYLSQITKKGRGALPIIWHTNDKRFEGKIVDRHVVSEWGEIKYGDWIGDGLNPNGEPKDSEGSEFLQSIFEEEDDRPIFVQMWGGSITFVQALYRFREKHGERALEDLMNKLHIFGIHLQDITFDFMINLDQLQEIKCLNMGDVASTYEGKRYHPRWFIFDHGHFWHYVASSEPNYVKPMPHSEVSGHGPMSEHYDGGGEGDSPSFLYLISGNLGLNDPLKPGQGSWGSLFVPMGEPFPQGYYSTCGVEKAHLNRWVVDAKRSFENRLNYSLKNPDEVNHVPVAVVQGKGGEQAQAWKAKPGATIQLDASKSHDPDEDQLNFKWYFYPEAGTLKDIPVIENASSDKIKFKMPNTRATGDLHLILEVEDSGSPSLKSYKRFIITL